MAVYQFSRINEVLPQANMGNYTRPIKFVGVGYWGDQDGIGSLIVDTLTDLGYEISHFRYDQTIPDELDLIFCYAPFGNLAPLSTQLKAMDPSQRPLFAFWLTEPLPNPAIPSWAALLQINPANFMWAGSSEPGNSGLHD